MAPRLRPFSWWSIDIAEDLGLVELLTSPKSTKRQKRDGFAMLVWAHLLEVDPATVEAEVAAGTVADRVREMKLRPESFLTLPDLPRLIGDFEKLLSDRRLVALVEAAP